MFKLIIVVSILISANGFKILGIFPYGGKSHFHVYEPLLLALAEKGHEVTVISHFPQEKPVPQYKDISVKNKSVILNFIDVRTLPSRFLNFYQTLRRLNLLAQKTCQSLHHPNFQKFVHSSEKFDVAIIEFFSTDCFLPLVHKFKLPFIGISTHPSLPWTLERLASSSNPATVPTVYSPFTHQMTFGERVKNFGYFWYGVFYYKWIFLPEAEVEARKLFGNDFPPLEDIARNSSLFLTNTHFILNGPRALANNVIEVGGLFLKKPKMVPEVRKFCRADIHTK